MSIHSEDSRIVTTHRLLEMKQRGEKISMLTAYDFTIGNIAESPTKIISTPARSTIFPIVKS